MPNLLASRSSGHQPGVGADQELTDFWQSKLAGCPAAINLPYDFPRPKTLQHTTSLVVSQLDVAASRRLAALGAAQGITPFDLLVGLFASYLHRLTVQPDLCLGILKNNEDDLGHNDVRSRIVNALPIRSIYCPGMTGLEYLKQLSGCMAASLHNGSLSFDKIVELSGHARDSNINPLFQVMFTREAGQNGLRMPSCSAIPTDGQAGYSFVDLTVVLREEGARIEIGLEYSDELFNHASIVRLADNFIHFVQYATTHIEDSVETWPMMTEEELSLVTGLINHTYVDYPRDVTFIDLFRENAAREPRREVVRFRDKAISYSDLDIGSTRLALPIRGLGLEADTPVALYMSRSDRFLIGMLAAFKAAHPYLPLDPVQPIDRNRAILASCPGCVIVYDEASKASAASLLRYARAHFCLEDVLHVSDGNCIPAALGPRPSDLAYLIFTSGSTGAPKGVMIEHRGMLNHLYAKKNDLSLSPSDHIAQTASQTFDISVWQFLVGLLVGCKTYIYPEDMSRDSQVVSYLNNDEITIYETVPSHMRMLLEDLKIKGAECERLFTALRFLVLTGEELTTDICREWLSRFPRIPIVNAYGPTECSDDVCHHIISTSPPSAPKTAALGRPIQNTRLYIVDALQRPVPFGAIGEIVVAGEGVGRGYWKDPDRTSQSFLTCGIDGGARVYRTGDYGRLLPDGTLEFKGRIDHQVKVRGFRIELEEIECVLLSHLAIREAVVMADEESDGGKRLIAYIVLRLGHQPSMPELRSYLRQRLPEYMVPSFFSVMAALPLTSSGKIDRPRLRSSAPALLNSAGSAASRTNTESLVANLFRGIFQLESVSVHDDFFELGGHSIDAASLLSQVRAATGKQLPVGVLLRASSVESLARAIEDGVEVGGSAVVTEVQKGSGSRLPFFAVMPPGEESFSYVTLARHMGREQPVYKVQGLGPITNGERFYTDDEMKALVAEYIHAIRTVQPDGPYCIGGDCVGVHISEQIVLSLEAQGDDVALFVIFDTWVMQNSQIPWLRQIDYYWRQLRRLKPLTAKQRVIRLGSALRNKLSKQIPQKRVGFTAATKPMDASWDWKRTYWPQDFVPARFRAPVLLFKRPKQPFFYITDPQMGWGARAGGGVEMHEIAFDHMFMFREPHVRAFGEILTTRIAGIAVSGHSARNEK